MRLIKSIPEFNFNNSLPKRNHTVSFATAIPEILVKTVISCWNRELAESLPGDAMYSLIAVKNDELGQREITAAFYADDIAWAALQSRGEIVAPRANRRFEGKIAANGCLSRFFDKGAQPRVHA